VAAKREVCGPRDPSRHVTRRCVKVAASWATVFAPRKVTLTPVAFSKRVFENFDSLCFFLQSQ